LGARCVLEGRPGVCNDLFATARGKLAVNSRAASATLHPHTHFLYVYLLLYLCANNINNNKVFWPVLWPSLLAHPSYFPPAEETRKMPTKIRGIGPDIIYRWPKVLFSIQEDLKVMLRI